MDRIEGSGTSPLLPVALLLAALAARRHASARQPRDHGATHRHAARRLHGAAAILAAAVLGDSGVEHYRSMFKNKAMFTPLVTSTLSLGASLHGLSSRRSLPHDARWGVYGLAALTGVVGSVFHLYNAGKRPGGASFENLFYGAPLGAPAALLLAGAVGLSAERVHEAERDPHPPSVEGWSLGKGIGALTALGLLGTAAEAALLHFRGNFQHRAMYLPVTIPPAAAALLGFAGAAFHARGIGRYMGSWRNWSQNLLDGPPIPAPPAFTGLALAGLAALSLMGNDDA